MQARGFFEQALALGSDNVKALLGVAWADHVACISSMTDDFAATLGTAEAALTKALALAPNYPAAHMMLGSLHSFTGRAAQAIAECEHALTLDRNHAPAHAVIGSAKFYLARAEETEGHVLEALRLSPRDNDRYIWMTLAGIVKCSLARDEEAVAWLHRAIEANRNFPLTHFYLAASLGPYRQAR
jgi:tetratricopeptide (TPR) repeat protein